MSANDPKRTFRQTQSYRRTEYVIEVANTGQIGKFYKPIYNIFMSSTFHRKILLLSVIPFVSFFLFVYIEQNYDDVYSRALAELSAFAFFLMFWVYGICAWIFTRIINLIYDAETDSVLFIYMPFYASVLFLRIYISDDLWPPGIRS